MYSPLTTSLYPWKRFLITAYDSSSITVIDSKKVVSRRKGKRKPRKRDLMKRFMDKEVKTLHENGDTNSINGESKSVWVVIVVQFFRV